MDLKVHLGCTKEVSSFDCFLQNFDKKYSPGGTYPINIGNAGSISIGRGANCPLIITLKVEEIDATSSPIENYIRVKGRCWGEKIFRRVITKTYENQKGEANVKDLIDNYVGLSHVRNSTELIENTDTTYKLLEYENSPVFDPLKYIAETADVGGVIGFDFRTAPDAKFEFFPRNSKTCSLDLTDKIESSVYNKDIHSVRNRIIIYGAAEKATPEDKDANTEDLTQNGAYVDTPDGQWMTGNGAGSVSVGTDEAIFGSKSLKHTTGSPDYYGCAVFTYAVGKEVDSNEHPSLTFQIMLEEGKNFQGAITLVLYDSVASKVYKQFSVTPGDFCLQAFAAGKKNSDQWTHDKTNSTPFDWNSIKNVLFYADFSGSGGVGTGSFWIDNLFWNHCRWKSIQEDTTSQNLYTDGEPRELVEIDEELHSDNECALRAKALLDHLKDPKEFLTIKSTIIDYGTNPILAGDKIHVSLPNENVDSDFRIVSVEYHVIAETQTLEITLELGKQKPLLADYLYGLRSTTITAEKLMRTKSGLRSIVSGGGGGGSSGELLDWLAPANIGPKSDAAAIMNFRTKNIAGDSVVDHQFNPSDDLHGVLGVQSKRWLESHFGYLFVSGYARLAQLNIGGYGGDQIVITPARVLQNVTADVGIITSGQFGLARMPRSTAGYVLEAQGVAADPMFVNPNGRYTPAGHNHAAGNITSGVLDEARCPNVYSNPVTFNGGIVTNSVNCANWQAADILFENFFRITEAEKLGLGKGLAFLSNEDQILMLLDGYGNVKVAGKIEQEQKLKKVKKSCPKNHSKKCLKQ